MSRAGRSTWTKKWPPAHRSRSSRLRPLELMRPKLPGHVPLPAPNLAAVWLSQGPLAQSWPTVWPACRPCGLALSVLRDWTYGQCSNDKLVSNDTVSELVQQLVISLSLSCRPLSHLPFISNVYCTRAIHQISLVKQFITRGEIDIIWLNVDGQFPTHTKNTIYNSIQIPTWQLWVARDIRMFEIGLKL